MRLENVWYRYGRGGPWVLSGVDLTLGVGEIGVVLGGNGVGKSTLLQIAAGVMRPSRGTVVERPATVGWVPERFPADQPHSVRSYLRAHAAMRKVSQADRAVNRWAERLGFTAYLDRRLASLSKGTAQKIGLAQALLRPPGLLVLDEPWEGLDAHTREEVPDIIQELVATGGSVLISDHRGEVSRLPGAARWHVADGQVSEVRPVNSRRWLVEVCVCAPDPSAAVSRMHAAGHQILGVRELGIASLEAGTGEKA